MSLLKRFDRSEWLRNLGALPVRQQFVAVKVQPLVDEAPSRPGEVATKERSVIDAHQCLVLAVDGVEVRRSMVLPVHVDHDPVELAEPRHLPTLRGGQPPIVEVDS